MINARIRPENTRLMGGGIDAFNLVNSPYGKSIGLGYKQAEQTVDSMRRGLPDPNRALFNLNPYNAGAQAAMPQQAAPQGPNADQMRWAQAFANSQQPANAPPAPPAANNPATPFTNQMISDSMRTNFVTQNPVMAGMQRGQMNRGTPTPQTPPTPTNFSRSALIEGAKKSGEFADIMRNYNQQASAARTGMRMNEQGDIVPLSKVADSQGTSPFARERLGAQAEDIAARRDFARGEAPVQKTTIDGLPGMVKINPYGTATRQDLPASVGVRAGMMPDPLTGKMIPMRQWAADQSAVQATKYGPDAAQAGADYFNRNAIARGIAAKMPAPTTTRVSAIRNPYGSAAKEINGPAGTIKGIPNAFPPQMTPEGVPPRAPYSGITTDSPAMRERIAAMEAGRAKPETIKAPTVFSPTEPLNAQIGQNFLNAVRGSIAPVSERFAGSPFGRYSQTKARKTK